MADQADLVLATEISAGLARIRTGLDTWVASKKAAVPPAPAPASKTGILVPLYKSPGSVWDQVAAVAARHPSVSIAAILNNANGPGPALSSAYQAAIPKLVAAGVLPVGYVYTQYGARPVADVDRDVASWRTWYPDVRAIFFDQMANKAGPEVWYRDRSTAAKSKGVTWTIGNPGTDTLESYVGTVDTMVVAESDHYPDLTRVTGWKAKYPKTAWGVLGYAVPLDVAKIRELIPYVGRLYFTSDTLAEHPWDSLPSYFEQLVTTLE
jgi:hypothetical protein